MPLYPSETLYPSESLWPGGPEPVPPLEVNGPQTNYYTDPGFESRALGYDYRLLAKGVQDTTRVVSDAVDSEDPTYGAVIEGAGSLRVEAAANSATGVIIAAGKRFTTNAAQVWSAGVWAGFSTAGMQGRLTLGFQDAEGAVLPGGAYASGAEAKAMPELIRVEGLIAPLEATFVVVELALVALAAEPGATTFDNALLVAQPVCPSYPIDGDRGGMNWVGSRFWSASYELPEAAVLADYRSWTPAYLWSPKVLSRELPS